MQTDERIDFEAACVRAASDLAVDKLCDVLQVAANELQQMRFAIYPHHEFFPSHCPPVLRALGRDFARSVIESIIDEPPISFGETLNAALEEDESIDNEEALVERIANQVKAQLKGALRRENPSRTPAA